MCLKVKVKRDFSFVKVVKLDIANAVKYTK